MMIKKIEANLKVKIEEQQALDFVYRDNRAYFTAKDEIYKEFDRIRKAKRTLEAKEREKQAEEQKKQR